MKKTARILIMILSLGLIAFAFSACNLPFAKSGDVVCENPYNITKTVLVSGGKTFFKAKNGKSIRLAAASKDSDGEMRRMNVPNMPKEIISFEMDRMLTRHSVSSGSGEFLINAQTADGRLQYCVEYDAKMFGREYSFNLDDSDKNESKIVQKNSNICYAVDDNDENQTIVEDADLVFSFVYRHSYFSTSEDENTIVRMYHVAIVYSKGGDRYLKTILYYEIDGQTQIDSSATILLDDMMLNYGYADYNSDFNGDCFFVYNGGAVYVYDSDCNLIKKIESENTIYGADYSFVPKRGENEQTFSIVYAQKSGKQFILKTEQVF